MLTGRQFRLFYLLEKGAVLRRKCTHNSYFEILVSDCLIVNESLQDFGAAVVYSISIFQ